MLSKKNNNKENSELEKEDVKNLENKLNDLTKNTTEENHEDRIKILNDKITKIDEELTESRKQYDELKSSYSDLKSAYGLMREELKSKQKTMDRDIENKVDTVKKDLANDIIPVADNFFYMKDSLQNSRAEINEETIDKNTLAVIDGLIKAASLIEKQIKQLLDEKITTTEVEVNEGDQFDPTKHMELNSESDNSKDNNTITKVLRKGYMYRNNLIRAAFVIVNRY